MIDRSQFDQLFERLQQDGYRLVGPTIREGQLVNDELTSTEDLPIGWTNEQEAGRYRLARRSDGALFGYTLGPHSWKQFLHRPRRRIWQARRTDEAIRFFPEPIEVERLAFVGARPCDVHAMAILDRALVARGHDIFIVAVNCGQPGGTCFCASMGTGPHVSGGFDVALTELIDVGRHRFVVDVGSERGASLMTRVPHDTAGRQDLDAAAEVLARAAAGMGRTMTGALENDGVKDLLYRNVEHPRWDDVAGRCLGCANCTMVCPTCFCSTVEDTTDLSGAHAERWQRWDSCFTWDFSYIHGGPVRPSAKARYRQWLMHKLATWFDQFGTSGCVGCGRCITWCPVGIDITEEVRAIRESEREPRHGNT